MSVFDDLTTSQLVVVAEFLLGVSYADGVIEGIEEDTVVQMLTDGLADDDVPDDVHAAIEDFDENGFDIEVAAEPLSDESEDIRFHLLRLAAAIREVGGATAGDDPVVTRVAEALDVEVELLDDMEALEFGPDEE